MTESNAVMLPKDVRPSKYTLTLQPDLEAFTFSGASPSTSTCCSPPGSIVLNAAELAIGSCRVESSAGEALPSSTTLDEKAETASFAFEAELPVGPARLEIEFTGELNDRLRGLLPQPVHRRERRGAAPGDDPVRGHRRPPRISMLGRAFDEGDVRGHARGPRGAGGRLEHHARRGVRGGRRA